MTTINDILQQSLVGKRIKVFQYDMYHLPMGQKYVHYNTTDNIKQHISNIDDWQDLKITEITTTILGAGGYFMDYEGNYISITIQTPDNKTYDMDINIDEELNIIEEENIDVMYNREIEDISNFVENVQKIG